MLDQYNIKEWGDWAFVGAGVLMCSGERCKLKPISKLIAMY
jgi:hypothetical protein